MNKKMPPLFLQSIVYQIPAARAAELIMRLSPYAHKIIYRNGNLICLSINPIQPGQHPWTGE